MVAPDAAGVEIIGSCVLAVVDEVVDLWSIEVVPGVVGVAGLSSPVALGDHYAVADYDALEVDGGLGVGIDEGTGEVGDVHAAVGLPCDPEVIRQELWELLEPGLQSQYTV